MTSPPGFIWWHRATLLWDQNARCHADVNSRVSGRTFPNAVDTHQHMMVKTARHLD